MAAGTATVNRSDRLRLIDVRVLMCGPPGSGKTTLARRLRRRPASLGYDFELAHTDDYSRRPYDRLYGRVVDSGADWILDGTFYRRELRNRFRSLCGVRVVWGTVDRETAVARNRDRSEPILEKGLHAMHSAVEPTEADLVLDTAEMTVDEATDRLESAVASWNEDVEGPADDEAHVG